VNGTFCGLSGKLGGLGSRRERHQFQPTVFHNWQKPFFENGAAAFERKNKRAEEAKDRQITALQEKLAKKNEVIAELMEENVRSKEANGEL